MTSIQKIKEALEPKKTFDITIERSEITNCTFDAHNQEEAKELALKEYENGNLSINDSTVNIIDIQEQ